MTPEEKARATIDAMLVAAGWVVQTRDRINLSAGRGVAICELSFATGEPDYTLFVDSKAIGTVEAKPEGITLTSVEEKRLVAEVERRLSMVEDLEAMVSTNLQRAGRLRQAVLQKAFTGALC